VAFPRRQTESKNVEELAGTLAYLYEMSSMTTGNEEGLFLGQS